MIRLEPLTGRHDRNGFNCGVLPLDIWLKETALQRQDKGGSRTFVAVPVDARAEAWRQCGHALLANSILGFYSLASAFVLSEDMPTKQAKRYPRQIPVTRLGRLAIRSDMQNQGLGKLLLADAITRAKRAAEAVGSAGLFVDAKNEAAARFYQRYGFITCKDQALQLFLPLW